MSDNPDDLGLEPPHPTFEDVVKAGFPQKRVAYIETAHGEGAMEHAMKVANGERSDVYGDPREHWTATGRGWAALIARRLGIACPDLPPDLVALMFDFDKSVRLCETPGHFDSHVDKHGYTHLHEQVV